MSDKNGILLINKPVGITSHDVVGIMRKVFQTKKIGHAGTLDPGATGVMVLGINQATRLTEYLMSDEKEYIASFYFGEERDTQDKYGEITATCELPQLTRTEFENVLKSFLGEQLQTPPMYSAIKKDGKPLYKYARQNITVEGIEDRKIFIFELECLDFTNKKASIRIHCSKGTYIRTLCQDIARKCGSCGTLSDLKRIKAGTFNIEQCLDIEDIKSLNNPYEILIPMNHVLDLPQLIIHSEDTAMDIWNGKKIECSLYYETPTLIQIVYNEHLIAIGTVEKDIFTPKKVFHI